MQTEAQTTSSASEQPKTGEQPAATEQPKVESQPAATAPKPAEEPKGTEQKKEEPKPKEEPQAEEKPLELKLPEGSKVNPSYLEKAKSLAKEKGWNQEQAQSHLEERHAAVEDYANEQQQLLVKLNDETWKGQLMEDPHFGGASFEENGVLAHQAATKFFGQEFADHLKAMNLNYHPDLFKGLVRIAKAGASDTAVFPGAETQGGTKSVAEELYPDMTKK